jgi:hypothetical protein
MGSIYKRGSRTTTRYYLHYRAGTKPDGSPHYEMRAAKGARSMDDARKQLAGVDGHGDPRKSDRRGRGHYFGFLAAGG